MTPFRLTLKTIPYIFFCITGRVPTKLPKSEPDITIVNTDTEQAHDNEVSNKDDAAEQNDKKGDTVDATANMKTLS